MTSLQILECPIVIIWFGKIKSHYSLHSVKGKQSIADWLEQIL